VSNYLTVQLLTVVDLNPYPVVIGTEPDPSFIKQK
jgi:hypothetical protein